MLNTATSLPTLLDAPNGIFLVIGLIISPSSILEKNMDNQKLSSELAERLFVQHF